MSFTKKRSGVTEKKELQIIKQKSRVIPERYIFLEIRITKATFIGGLAKTGQDQQLKLSAQRHILFYKVFLDKEHSKPLPKQMSLVGTL